MLTDRPRNKTGQDLRGHSQHPTSVTDSHADMDKEEGRRTCLNSSSTEGREVSVRSKEFLSSLESFAHNMCAMNVVRSWVQGLPRSTRRLGSHLLQLHSCVSGHGSPGCTAFSGIPFTFVLTLKIPLAPLLPCEFHPPLPSLGCPCVCDSCRTTFRAVL